MTIERQPAGTRRCELERIRDQAFERFRSLYKQYEHKARLIESGVRQILPFVEKLSNDWELDKSTFTLACEIEKPVHAFLERELSGNEAEETVTKLIRRAVKVELDIE